MSKSVKGFEDAGQVERPANKRQAVPHKRQWPDMKTPVLRTRPRTTFERDQGRNATRIRQPRDFIWAPKRAAYPLFAGPGGTGKMISEAIFQPFLRRVRRCPKAEMQSGEAIGESA